MEDRKYYAMLGILAFLAFLSFLSVLVLILRSQNESLVTTADIERARELIRKLENAR